MCERHQLDATRANDLLPLVERALVSPDDVRSRVLTMIDDTIQRRARGDTSATGEALERDLDEEVLRAVARTVHTWDPPWRRAPGAGGDATDHVEDFGGDLPEGLGGGL